MIEIMENLGQYMQRCPGVVSGLVEETLTRRHNIWNPVHMLLLTNYLVYDVVLEIRLFDPDQTILKMCWLHKRVGMYSK